MICRQANEGKSEIGRRDHSAPAYRKGFFGFGLVVVRFVIGTIGRLGPRDDAGDHAAHDLDADVLGDLDLQFLAVEHLGDGADDAAIGDDFVAATQGAEHFAVHLHLLLLRTDQQEVKDDEDQDERQQRHHIEGARRASGLRVSMRSNISGKANSPIAVAMIGRPSRSCREPKV